MIDAQLIKTNTPIVCSEGSQFGVVERVDGAERIKLKKDAKGQRHAIPMSWVTSVDDKVHIDRTSEQAMLEWTTLTMGKRPA